MAITVKLTQDEFEEIATRVVSRIVQEAALVMQAKVQRAGFVLTSALMNSIHVQTLVMAAEMNAEFAIGFEGYGRFKDMRQLLYEKMPPIEVMEDFVRQIGVDKFSYIPGYMKDANRRVVIPDARAVNRIAWGIARSRVFVGAIRHNKKNAFYNPTRGKLIYETADRMLQALPEPIMRGIKQQLEGV